MMLENKKSEELYEKSLVIRERVLGEGHPDTAVSYNNLAGLYKSQEKYKSTISYCFKLYNVFPYKLLLEKCAYF